MSDRAARRQGHTGLSRPVQAVDLIRAVAVAANQSLDIEQAASTCLARVCDFTGWPLGHLYTRARHNPDLLISSDAWCIRGDPARFDAFQQATRGMELRAGIGLPGRVVATGTPAWIVDLAHDSSFPRAGAARKVGLKSGFASPILVGDEVAAVLEFFATASSEPDSSLMEIMGDIGAILGRVVERQRAAEALRESEERFRSVTQSAVDAIISADAEGNIVSWNHGAEMIFGYSTEEVVGKPLTTLMPERYRSRHTAAIERVSSGGEMRTTERLVEMHGIRKDGTEFPLELAVGNWQTSDGRFYAWVIRDITRRKQAEEEIKRLNASLEQRVADRTSELEKANLSLKREIEERERLERHRDEFISAASHELRTPLTAIKGYSQLALREATKQGDQRLARFMAMVDRKSDEVIRLINEMLDIPRIEDNSLPLETEPFDLRQLVADVAAEAETMFPDLVLALDLPTEPVEVVADRQRIDQVLSNMLDNAIKYGATNVEQVGHPPPGIEIGLRSQKNEAVAYVRDRGVGIPEKQQFQVFKRFFRADNIKKARYPYTGLGIGLYISDNIVRRHGGRMWVESVEGKGSTFYFTLPLPAHESRPGQHP